MLSFVVPAYNEEPLIASALQALNDAGAALEQPFEVVVADDASIDATAAIAREHGARVVAVCNRQIAATRNAGAKAAAGDMLIFVDADTIVTRAAVRAAVDAMHAGAAGGGCALRFDGEVPLLGRLIEKTAFPIYRVLRISGGCFLFCTRQAFQATGGFDEDMFAVEELAMCRALHRHGRFVVLREAVTTSGRRMRAYSQSELLRFMLRMMFSGARDRQKAHLWYEKRRPDPGWRSPAGAP